MGIRDGLARGISGLADTIARARGDESREITTTTPPGKPISRNAWAGEWSDLTADWSVTPITSFSLIHQNLNTLRARARTEAMRNDYAKRFIGMLKNGVVGPEGFQLQCQFEDPGGMDDVANRAFEKHWKLWADNPKNCDIRGQFDFAELCRQAIRGLAVDGEIIVRHYRRGPMDYQLQIIDPFLLDVTYNETQDRSGRKVRFGIEIDEVGAPVRYWFNQPQEYYFGAYGGGDRMAVPADEIYHCFIGEGVDQYRGLPWLSTPMYRMHMVAGFEEASLVNARAGASKMGFIKSRDPAQYAGESGAAGGGVEEIAAGSIGYLNENQDWQPHNPDYPTGEFKDYHRQMLRGVASGLEVSYPTLANDLEGVNYTSLRHDALTERDVYMTLQNWFCQHFLKPVYRDWLETRLMSPEGVPIPRRGGGSRPARFSRKEKYLEVRFQGRRWQWVDPLKEVQAQREAIQLGITTREQVIRDAGRDPEEVMRAVENERERFGPVESPDDNTEAQAAEPDAPGGEPGSEDS